MKPYLTLEFVRFSQACALVMGAMLIGQGNAFAAEPVAAEEETQVQAGEAVPTPEEDKAPPQAEEEQKSEAEPAEAEAEETPEEYRNWFETTVGGLITSGDKAAARRRYGLPAGAFGGVSDFHYEEDVGKKGLFKVDGRGIFDNDDYALKLDLEHPDIGFVRAGYREFRSYYDGTGGFFHPEGLRLQPFDDDLAVERGDAFFEAGLTLPGKPSVRFRYDHMFRDGRKDSTAWGDLATGFGTRKIVPGFWDIDESRDIFALDAKHTLAKTTFGVGLRYETSDQNNSRNILRTPGDRYGTTREEVDTDLFNVHAFSETRFTEKVWFTTGYSFTTLDTDLSGYRVYGTTYDPVFAQRLPIPDSFENLSGGSELQQHVANLNLMWRLSDSLVLVPSLRVEREDIDSGSAYLMPAAPLSGFPYDTSSERGLLDVSERLELRYTGITNWVFYTRGEWLQGSGDLQQRWDNVGPGAVVVDRDTDDSRFWQTYTVGANWYPIRRLNFGAQYYHKERWNEFDHDRDSTPNSLVGLPSSVYPAFLTAQDFTTDDMNFRVTWRPRNNVTLVGRYDFQLSTIDTKPDSASGLSRKETSDMTSHILSGTASWSPIQRLYLQGGLSYVWDRTDTPADEITRTIQEARNDYWTANSTIGYALDDKTDLQLQYLYYRADNFQDNSVVGLPYGAEAEEHGITATVTRRINNRMRVSLRYGFFDGEDRTTGHQNDYQAHLVYSSLHYRF